MGRRSEHTPGAAAILDIEAAGTMTDRQGRIRVGLAGAGWVSAHHLDAWRQVADRAVVVAIADPDRAAAAARAGPFGISAAYDSVEAMLEAEALDAIDIAAPREMHAPLCRLAADRGLAILCQKPLAPTYEEAVALLDDIGDRVRLMVHENWRFRPHYRRIRTWLEEGRIGDVRTAVMAILTSGLLPDGTGALPALVRQPMLASLDRMLLMEVMIHHVDTLRFLLGPLVLEGARLGKRCAAIRGEDRAALLLRSGEDAAVSLIGDFMAHGHPAAQRDRLEILGSDGAILLEEDRLRLIAAKPQALTLDIEANYVASYRAAIAHFADRLLDGQPFETDAADNLETLELVEEAYRIGG